MFPNGEIYSGYFPHGFDKSADLLSKRQNHEEDFFQIMCASQKVRTLKHFTFKTWLLIEAKKLLALF